MSEWISVEDRLPEYKSVYDCVLVCDASDSFGSIRYAIAWRERPSAHGNVWNCSSDLWEDRHITHWMPLPELPGGEK